MITELDLLRTVDRGEVVLALLYGTASIALGFLALAVGTAIVRRARLT